MRDEQCWIYMFRDLGGILYVGQTRDLYREERHRKKNPELRDAIFKLVRQCNSRDASRLERQIILACKRKGQARLNRNIPKASRNYARGDTLSARARKLGISLAALNNHIRGGYTWKGKFRRYVV